MDLPGKGTSILKLLQLQSENRPLEKGAPVGAVCRGAAAKAPTASQGLLTSASSSVWHSKAKTFQASFV